MEKACAQPTEQLLPVVLPEAHRMQLFCAATGWQLGFSALAHHAPSVLLPYSITVQLASKLPVASTGAKPGCMW